ncbi:hypothetical protein [Nostoc sp. 106C]|nr:hypothetical protein [Nostoc sp. 106C]
MTWQLWLARDIVAGNPLPWQTSSANSVLICAAFSLERTYN